MFLLLLRNQNRFILEEKMKKILSLFLALIMMLSLCMVLISCNNNDNSDSNDQNENNLSDNVSNDSNSPDELFNVDLAGYVANIGNATAIGISQKASSAVSPAAYGRAKSGSMLLLHSAPTPSQNNSESKNYIVMSTTDYDANTPETDENGLTKVSFTKIITENVTTETTGTRYVIANKGRIFISANEGFKYSVYYNDALVYNEIQDNDSNDKDDKIGIIVLDNLIEGVEYKVDYKGIGVTTTVTQDDIGGEIDKLYVLNGYTFISFVPQG